MAKHFQRANATFIACGEDDASAQATFTDIYNTVDESTPAEEAEMVLNGDFSQIALDLTNTGQNLTDFQMLGKVHRSGGWHVMITGATWNTVAGNLKEVVGTLNTLASGSAGMAVVETGPLYAVKFQAKIANGVRNAGTFTASANPTNTAAAQDLTVNTSENFANGDEVVIDDVTYTFVTALTTDPAEVPFEVLIGVDANTSLDNLELAIEAGAGAGTVYGTGTTAHPTVTASVAGDVLAATAITPGTGGNAIEVSTDAAEAAWGDTTLAGGTTETFTIGSEVYTFKAEGFATETNDVEIGADAAATITAAIAKINATHTQVTAAETTGDALIVTAIDGITNAVGTAIATTETCAQCAWGATTLADAVMTSVAVNVIAMK